MPSFLAPLFLAGAAAAALPIVLHLLRREPESRVRFPAVRLLKQAPVELTDRRRLRELLLLALRVAALLLLALAFARPFFAAESSLSDAGTTVVALDTSYSLSSPGRFARAQQLAREAIGKVRSGDLVGVVAFSDTASVIARPSADRGLAVSAVNAATTGNGGTRYRAGLEAAAQALNGRRGAIVVVTDLQASGWDAGDRAAVPNGVRVQVADVGAPPDDLAVTGLRVDGARLVATIRNTAGKARDASVHLRLDDKPARDTSVLVAAGGSADVVFDVPARAGAASVSVDDPGGLQPDNVRYLALDGAAHPAVLLVTANGDPAKDAFYAFHALTASAGGIEPLRVTGVRAAALGSWDDAQLSDVTAVLLVSTRGLDRRGRELLARYVGAGGGIVVAAGPDVDGAVAADVLGADTPITLAPPDTTRAVVRTLAPADARHPILKAFAFGTTLGLVKFKTVSAIGGRACQPIARFTSGEPAVIDCAAGEGRAIVLASDLDDRWNDFPVHATFLPFIQETVHYVAGSRPRGRDFTVADVPPGVAPQPGVMMLPGGSRLVAVNVEPQEADPSRISADEFRAAVSRLTEETITQGRTDAAEQEERQHLWQYALVLVMAALAAEALVASRTT